MHYLKLFEGFHDPDPEEELLSFIDDGDCVLSGTDNMKVFTFIRNMDLALNRLTYRKVKNYFVENNGIQIIWISQAAVDEFKNIIENIKYIHKSIYDDNEMRDRIYYKNEEWIFYYSYIMGSIECNFENYTNRFTQFNLRKFQLRSATILLVNEYLKLNVRDCSLKDEGFENKLINKVFKEIIK